MKIRGVNIYYDMISNVAGYSKLFPGLEKRMSLETKLVAFAQAVGEDIGELISTRGKMAALTTTQKTSLVAAINELKAGLNSVDPTALINDAAGAGVVDKTWSADKITTALSTLKSEIIAGAPEAYDTLQEIADYLAANDGALNALLTSINNRVRFDAAQALTVEQKLTACTNIGVGNPEVNLVAAYADARDAR